MFSKHISSMKLWDIIDALTNHRFGINLEIVFHIFSESLVCAYDEGRI